MTYYYYSEAYSLLRFDDDPQTNADAYAEEWSPDSGEWGPKGRLAYDVRWGGDYHAIPESAVAREQERCHDLALKAKAFWERKKLEPYQARVFADGPNSYWAGCSACSGWQCHDVNHEDEASAQRCADELKHMPKPEIEP